MCYNETNAYRQKEHRSLCLEIVTKRIDLTCPQMEDKCRYTNAGTYMCDSIVTICYQNTISTTRTTMPSIPGKLGYARAKNPIEPTEMLFEPGKSLNKMFNHKF